MEGGSANDYDYCSADPLNCIDLAGTYGYSYTKTVQVGASWTASRLTAYVMTGFGHLPVGGHGL